MSRKEKYNEVNYSRSYHGYGIESASAKGEKPTTFYQLEQCSSISGLDLSTEQIDVSDLASLITEYAAGKTVMCA